MSAKLDRIGTERDKALRRRDEWEARYKELDKKYREQENIEIHEMVHAANLNPEQLARLLQMASQTMPKPEILEQVKKEETQNED